MQFVEWLEKTEGKKMIITNRSVNGERLLRKYNREYGKDIREVKCVSLQELAKELLCAVAALEEWQEEINLLQPEACVYKLNELLSDYSFSFVPKESLCVRTAETILKSLNQLRMNETKVAFKEASEQKVKDIRAIIALYEESLQKEQLYDLSMLLRKACQVFEKVEDKSKLLLLMPGLRGCSFGVLADYEMTLVEQQFMNGILRLLEEDLTTLEFVQDNNASVSYHFFKAYGVVNEIDFILDKIEKENIAYGDVSIFYTAEVYEPFLKGAFESKGIPYGFLTGMKAQETNAVQFLLGILEWAGDDFLYEKLAPVIDNSQMTFKKIYSDQKEKACKSPGNCYNKYLRKGIGWGKERYIECIARVRENEEEAAKFEYFHEFLEDLLMIFWDGADCGQVFERLVACGKKYLYRGNKENNTIMEALKEQIPVIKRAGMQKTEGDSLRFISNHLKSLALQAKEDAGKVQVMKVGNPEVLERPYTFVIGLSAKQFSADVKESPVLSDEELISYIDGKADLAKDAAIHNRENLENSFGTLKEGCIYLGYTTFDTIDLKESSPSVLYQDYLERYGNGVIEEQTYKVIRSAVTIADSGIKEFAKQKIGVHENETAEEDPEEFEEDEEEDDAQSVLEVSISPSGLQTLLACPLKYYYNYVENLSQREFLERSSTRWLNPAAKGNLFHRTMEKYCNEVFGREEITAATPAQIVFKDIYAKAVESMLEENPYTSPIIYKQECQETEGLIWEYLCDFQKGLYQDYVSGKKWRILGCEIDFENVKSILPHSQEYGDAPDISLGFRGSIDRLDGYVNEEGILCLRIVDYKTGDSKKKEKEIREQRQLQHFVYAMAAVSLAEKRKEEWKHLFGREITDILIEAVQYVFPYEEKGNRVIDVTALVNGLKTAGCYALPGEVCKQAWNYLFYISEPECKEDLDEILSGQEDKAKKALENTCKYCNYSKICRCRVGDV